MVQSSIMALLKQSAMLATKELAAVVCQCLCTHDNSEPPDDVFSLVRREKCLQDTLHSPLDSFDLMSDRRKETAP